MNPSDPKQLRWHQRLIVKSLVRGTLLTLVALACIAVAFMAYERKEQLNAFEDTNEALLAISATALKLPLWNFADQQTQFLLEGLSKSPDFCGAKVTDMKGEILAETKSPENSTASNHTDDHEISRKIYKRTILIDDPTTEEEVEVAIGTIELCYDLGAVLSILEKQQNILALAIIVILVGSTLAWWYSFNALIKPLGQLGQAMDDSRLGLRRIENPELLAKNEVGMLGNQFNRMADEINDREQQLQLRITEVQEAMHAKSTFMSNMSHELRTPMHAILSYAEMGLKQTPKGNVEKLTKYFTNISTSGNRLLGLINGLLDFSKLEAGKMALDFAEHDIVRIVSDAQAELEPLFSKKSLTFSLHSDLPTNEVSLDSVRIAQVLINIFSNSIRYAPNGSHITATLEAVEHNKPAVQLTIGNLGPRIPEMDLEYIFDPFFQSISPKNAGGTGLGLAICREIIIAHDGKIWAENQTPEGVKFCIILPFSHTVTDEASYEV